MTTLLEPPQMPSALPPPSRADRVILHMRPLFDWSDDQFFAFCQQNRDLRIEQTTQGDLIVMPPTGGGTGSRNSELTRLLGNWARSDGSGITFDSSTGFTLPSGAKKSPDASWVLRSRLAALTPAQKEKFLPLCPDFVVELRSPSDGLEETQAKMQEYLDNGARLGWLLDAADRRVFVYRPGQDVEILDTTDTISADPELPGFTLELALIWDPDF
jgi:Uma2 family endonuclease